MTLIEPMDYVVRLVALPTRVRAFTSVDEEGRANIYINKLLPRYAQEHSFWHELEHILQGDFWSLRDIRLVESVS